MRPGSWNTLIGVATRVVVIAGLRAAATILIPLVVASLLVLLVTAFILLEAPDFRPRLQAAFGMTDSDMARLVTGGQNVYQFLWIKTLVSVGSLSAARPPVLLALLDGGAGRSTVVAVGYVALNISFGSVLEPRLIGRRLGLSPLALLVSLIFWGWVWGPVGLVLSVPLTMSVKLLLENFDRARWLVVHISRAPDATGEGRTPRS